MVLINVNKVCKYLSGKKVLKEISFYIRRGESFCLLGPNGAGKTTTVRLILGFYKPDCGSITVKGLDPVCDYSEIHRFIGYLPEYVSLYDRLSIYRNLEFFGLLYDIPRDTLKTRIKKMLDLLGLWDRREDKVGYLSKGLKKRVALARALIHEPDILILDQPTTDLDPEMAFSLRSFIKRLHKEFGLTLLICTHNLHEAEELCDTICILNDGHVIYTGPLDMLRYEMMEGEHYVIETEEPVVSYKDVILSLDKKVLRFDEIDDYKFEIVVEAREDITYLLNVLVARGIRILEVCRQKPSLEKIYLRILGGEK